MIYKLRIILDNNTDDDIFRDIEINETDTLENLNDAILQSFGFDGLEMASFYISDENWNQGEEISQFDVSENDHKVRVMNKTILNDVLHEAQSKLIYVYDFFNLWTFFVELIEISDETIGQSYPNVTFIKGQVPDEAPEKDFSGSDFDSDDNDDFNDFEDDLDPEDYDNLNFDENWN